MGRSGARFLRAMCAGALFAFALSAPAFAAAPSSAPGAAAPAEVDVALVLAIDSSGSIDYQEADLQRKGIAEAFLSDEVLKAIQSGSLGRIGVAAIYFSSRSFGWMGIAAPWTLVRDKDTAQNFVRTLLAAQRYSGRGTSISDALELSQRMFQISPFASSKLIIDVSGDGVNNAGRPMLEVRDETLAKGIAINGLPIIDETTPQDLDKYFQGCVIGGPGSFVLVAKGFADFGLAMRRKLVLEISGLMPGEMPAGAPLLKKVAAAPVRPAIPSQDRFVSRNPPYPGGCDYPQFGGFGGFGGFSFPPR